MYKLRNNRWLKPVLTLSTTLALVWMLPNSPLDSWNLINPKKIATMIFALTFIQILGMALAQLMGPKRGALLTGFLGGLVSSTVTTASIARQSLKSTDPSYSIEILTFLAATLAMLFEGLFLIFIGFNEPHPTLYILFTGPVVTTAALLYFQSKKDQTLQLSVLKNTFEISSILKLTAFIILILTLSKSMQVFLGQSGLFVITFLVSLFEIHGSIIANVQMHDNGTLNIEILGKLISISILASYLSKIFLIWTLGHVNLRKRIIQLSGFLLASLLISFAIFVVTSGLKTR